MNLGLKSIINSWRHEVAARWAPDLKGDHLQVAVCRIVRDGGRGGSGQGKESRGSRSNIRLVTTPSTAPTGGQWSLFLCGMSRPSLSFAQPSDTANSNTHVQRVRTSSSLFKLAISTVGS